MFGTQQRIRKQQLRRTLGGGGMTVDQVGLPASVYCGMYVNGLRLSNVCFTAGFYMLNALCWKEI